MQLVINTVSHLATDELDYHARRRRVGGRGRPHGQGRLPHPARRRAAAHPLLHVARHRSGAGRRDDQAAGWREVRHRPGARLPRGCRRGDVVTSSLRQARDERGEVVAVDVLGGGMVEVSVRLPHLAATALPGQFAQLRCGDGFDPLLRRPFSVAWTDGERRRVRPRARRRGHAHPRRRCSPAMRLTALGPLGTGFTVADRRGARSVSAAASAARPSRCWFARCGARART